MAQARIEPMQALDCVERIAAMSSAGEVWAYFSGEAARAGYPAHAIHLLSPAGMPDFEHFCLGTWPSIWRDAYAAEKLTGDDAIIEVTPRFTRPVTWKMMRARRRRDGRSTRVFDVARSLGWRDGFAIPIFGHGGYRALAGFACESDSHSSRDRAALHMMSLYVHERLKELLAPDAGAPEVELTQGELECVRWLLAGKGDWEIGEILCIAQATAHWRIEQAKKKLGVHTRAQLTALAVHRGLVTP